MRPCTHHGVQGCTHHGVQARPFLVPTAKIKSAGPLIYPLIEKKQESRYRDDSQSMQAASSPHVFCEEATGLRGAPAPKEATTGSVEGDVGPGVTQRARDKTRPATEDEQADANQIEEA